MKKILWIVAFIELAVIIYFVVKEKQRNIGTYNWPEQKIRFQQQIESTRNRYRNILVFNGLDPDEAEEKFNKAVLGETGGILFNTKKL